MFGRRKVYRDGDRINYYLINKFCYVFKKYISVVDYVWHIVYF